MQPTCWRSSGDQAVEDRPRAPDRSAAAGPGRAECSAPAARAVRPRRPPRRTIDASSTAIDDGIEGGQRLGVHRQPDRPGDGKASSTVSWVLAGAPVTLAAAAVRLIGVGAGGGGTSCSTICSPGTRVVCSSRSRPSEPLTSIPPSIRRPEKVTVAVSCTPEMISGRSSHRCGRRPSAASMAMKSALVRRLDRRSPRGRCGCRRYG